MIFTARNKNDLWKILLAGSICSIACFLLTKREGKRAPVHWRIFRFFLLGFLAESLPAKPQEHQLGLLKIIFMGFVVALG